MQWTDAIIILAALTIAIFWYLARWAVRRRQARATAQMNRNEQAAAALLVDQGFVGVRRAPRVQWTTRIDGRRYDHGVRASLLARRGRRSYAVDIHQRKTGSNRMNRQLRRRLLEFVLAYGVSGVILLDLERSRIRCIEFGVPGTARRILYRGAEMLGTAAAGAAVMYLVLS